MSILIPVDSVDQANKLIECFNKADRASSDEIPEFYMPMWVKLKTKHLDNNPHIHSNFCMMINCARRQIADDLSSKLLSGNVNNSKISQDQFLKQVSLVDLNELKSIISHGYPNFNNMQILDWNEIASEQLWDSRAVYHPKLVTFCTKKNCSNCKPNQLGEWLQFDLTEYPDLIQFNKF